VTVNTFIMLQKVSMSNKCCSFELSVHQRILEKYQGFNRILIIILEWFLKDHLTLKTGVMMMNSLALITGIQLNC